MSYLFKYYSKQYDKFMKIFNLDKNKEIVKVLKDINNLEILDIGWGNRNSCRYFNKFRCKCNYS